MEYIISQREISSREHQFALVLLGFNSNQIGYQVNTQHHKENIDIEPIPNIMNRGKNEYHDSCQTHH